MIRDLKIHTKYHIEPTQRVFSLFLFCCRPVKCPQCPVTFMENEKWRLKRHMVMHSRVFEYNCHLCNKMFRRKYNRDKHVRTHLQIRTFHCEYCAQTFLTGEGLRNHIGVHTGERRYKCGLCPMAFNFTASCSQHRRKHLGPSGNYQCEKCSEQIESFRRFKMHMDVCMPGRLLL